MPRAYFCSLIVSIVCATPGLNAYENEEVVLLKMITQGKSVIVGELGSESETRIEVLDYKTGKRAAFEKATLRSIRKGISDTEAVASVGLANVLVPRIHSLMLVTRSRPWRNL